MHLNPSNREAFMAASSEKKAAIKVAWHAWMTKNQANFMTVRELQELVANRVKPQNVGVDTTSPVKGSVTFGSDAQIFYEVYALITDRKVAEDVTRHELEHAKVYARYGVEYSFGVILARDTPDFLIVQPLIEPAFPREMSVTERLKILREAVEGVSEQSWGDKVTSVGARFMLQSITNDTNGQKTAK